MSDSTNSALSNASAFRRAGAPAQGGVIEALAKSPLNHFGLCGQDDASTAPADLEAGRIDITARFDDAHRLSRRLQAGVVWINTYSNFDPAVPFGGVKESGWGRELGAEAIDAYLNTKAVWVQVGEP